MSGQSQLLDPMRPRPARTLHFLFPFYGQIFLTDLALRSFLQSITDYLDRPGGRQDVLERHTRARATLIHHLVQKLRRPVEVLICRLILVLLTSI